MDFGISEYLIENITSVIKANGKIKDAVIFGSRAIGNWREGSDIDIALKGVDLSTEDIIEINLQLQDTVFPYQLDLVLYDRIKTEALTEHIDRVGVSLFHSVHAD